MDITKEAFLLHARALILGFYSNLWRIVGHNPSKDLPEEIQGYELSVSNVQIAMEDPNVRKFLSGDLMKWFEKVYDYGTDGIDDPSTEPEDEEESCIPFWGAFEHLLLFISYNTDEQNFNAIRSYEIVNHFVKKYFQRWELDSNNMNTQFIDGEPCIFLTDLAGLADLDEKTIRNMASKKLEGFPALLKFENRTYVTKKEARAWLVSRGWKETVYLGDKQQAIKLPDVFHAPNHVLEFFTQSLEQARDLFNLENPIKEVWFKTILGKLNVGDLDLPLDAVAAWGHFIKVSSYDLALTIHELKSRLEAERLKAHFILFK
ncbi:hypothetical protein EV673_1601 [Limnobacter thiooxidans]|uniref:Uncharacterized protein n=1 Tax=Limnobacter thiooxidans TaxID=131080 RepID=A0AA86IX25_9BURK|nr:hypothetical protein EV673_1601 [Limnobacter thiooxidans]BET24529.1 hypothetical protein RGQ30_00300 [Limnobacter thiooxidans]